MSKYNLINKLFSKHFNRANIALFGFKIAPNVLNVQRITSFDKRNLISSLVPKPLINPILSSLLKTKNIICISILGWLGFVDDDENKESELIMTLKRAILCQQREEYEKAEILLHVALRLAQQQQNQQGILYTYDLMANLAFEKLELQKASKLFVEVMQRLLAQGVKEDDLKVIHISLKLARICHLLAEPEKAEVGYKWCLGKIEKQREEISAKTLYGVIQDWYAQFLLDENRVKESLAHLHEAYKICCEVKGKTTEETLLLLNDLGITSWRAGDLFNAELFLTEAVGIGKVLDNKAHVGIVHANLGLIQLQKGVMEEAKKSCKEAWHLGKRYDNTESVEQANYCFEQIKLLSGK